MVRFPTLAGETPASSLGAGMRCTCYGHTWPSATPQGTSIRIYVDDITLSAVAPTAREVVRRLGRGVPQVKRQLAEKAMITGDSKEQFFSHPGCAQHLA